MTQYSIGDRIFAVVERIMPFGVFVQLEDGTPAYIRLRDLDLDANVESSHIVSCGDRFLVIVSALAEDNRLLEVSRRAALPDPWNEFAKEHRAGDFVNGTVRAIQARGAFVRIAAGIDGFVPLEEFATWQVDRPETQLWIGDEVEAVITRVDLRAKRLGLSIRARMLGQQKAMELVERLERQAPTQGDMAVSLHDGNLVEQPLTFDERERVGQIFIVDDHDPLRNELIEQFRQLDLEVYGLASAHEAREQIQADSMGIVFVDLHLGEEDGLELIRQWREQNTSLTLCVMSSPEFLAERISQIRDVGADYVFAKPFDVAEIQRFLVRRARGETIPTVWSTLPHPTRTGAMLRQLANGAPREHHPRRRLENALTRIAHLGQADQVILFGRDGFSNALSIVGASGTLHLNRDAIYDLKVSPVQDIMLGSDPIVESDASGQGRFRKLLTLLDFRSCLGLPIEANGETNHALFLFFRKVTQFSRMNVQSAAAGALWIGTILESQIVDARMRAANPLLLSGELAASFAHEVYNKVSGLDLQVRNLGGGSLSVNPARLELLQDSMLDLQNVVASFQHMMRAKDNVRTFDVNIVLRRAETLLRPFARKEGVTLVLRLDEGPMPVNGNEAALQQVFLNVMLNAVQQMALKPQGKRLLEIVTTLAEGEKSPCIVVRFVDTGPGIHRKLWEKIFALGFSTRGGSGLGLYIARSLLDSFDGRLQVEESFIPLGTTLRIELPVAKESIER